MTIDFDSVHPEESTLTGLPTIKVFGVGGGGGNVVNRMIEDGIKGVDYIVGNTDRMVLNSSLATKKIPLGTKTSKGLGAGMKPEVGKMAAEEDQDAIKEALEDTDMVFISAGMGGGTGTGAAPVIAEIAKEMKILTVGVVTTPFLFEGGRRAKLAKNGIDELKKHVDTLMVIPNNKLLEIVSQKTTMDQAFAITDDVLKQAISGITNLINMEGLINLDFADVKTVMSNKGRAIMGTGVSTGENRGLEAAQKAITSPLLSDRQISGAKGIIINIVADAGFTLMDAQAAAEYIQSSADQEADVIFGFVCDPEKTDEVAVTVIATGFDLPLEEQEKEPARQGPKLRIGEESVKKPVAKPVETAPVSPATPEVETPVVKTVPPVREPEPVVEEVIELEPEYMTEVETDLYYPDYKENEYSGKNKFGEKSVDYEVPTFIRQRSGFK